MKRNVLLALVAALALALGFGSVATAGAGEAAQASAKKGKGKGCKGKGKAKGKSSATASAKGKAKGKGKGCKAKGKGPQPKPEPAPAPPTPAPPTPSSWPLSDGTYDGQEGVGITIKSGGTQAALKYAGTFGKTCIPLPIETDASSVSATGDSFTASGEASGSLKIKWSITVTPDLKYKLVLDSSYAFPDQDPCDKPGVEFTGTLTKAG